MRLKTYILEGIWVLVTWILILAFALWALYDENNLKYTALWFGVVLCATSPFLFAVCMCLRRAGKREIKDNYVISYTLFGKELLRIDARQVVYAKEISTLSSSFVVIANEKTVLSKPSRFFERLKVDEAIAFESDTYFECIHPYLNEVIFVENQMNLCLNDSVSGPRKEK